MVVVGAVDFGVTLPLCLPLWVGLALGRRRGKRVVLGGGVWGVQGAVPPTGLSWVGGVGRGGAKEGRGGRVRSGTGLVLGGCVGLCLLLVVVDVVLLMGLLVVTLLGGGCVILGVALPPEVQEGVFPPGSFALFMW